MGALNLDNTLGAAFLGLLAAAILYGVTSVQTFIFFRNSKGDGWKLKSFVLFLWALDTIHLGLTTDGVYKYLVSEFGNLKVLVGPTWTLLSQVFITNISDLLVRFFFARRVSVLCGRREKRSVFIPAVIVILSCLVCAFGCGFAAKSFELKTYERMNDWMLYASFGSAVVADLIIAISLCILLLKSKTGFERTDSILTFLMAFIINTGLLTSITAIACFVTYAIWPQRFIFMGIYFALSKLYVNALLGSLNARNSLRARGHGNGGGGNGGGLQSADVDYGTKPTLGAIVSGPIEFPSSRPNKRSGNGRGLDDDDFDDIEMSRYTSTDGGDTQRVSGGIKFSSASDSTATDVEFDRSHPREYMKDI